MTWTAQYILESWGGWMLHSRVGHHGPRLVPRETGFPPTLAERSAYVMSKTDGGERR